MTNKNTKINNFNWGVDVVFQYGGMIKAKLYKPNTKAKENILSTRFNLFMRRMTNKQQSSILTGKIGRIKKRRQDRKINDTHLDIINIL